MADTQPVTTDVGKQPADPMLGTLRTAKTALDEGLITQEDYDSIKTAFMKAQQIKAGLDAGFIREQDYQRTKDAFLHSLDFTFIQANPVAANPVAIMAPPVKVENGGAAHAVAAAAAPAASIRPIIVPRSSSAAPARVSAAAATTGSAPQSPANATAPAFVSMPAPVQRSSAPPPSFADLPKIGKAGDVNGKKAMSGICVNDETINVFNHIKTKSTYKWVIYKVDDAGKEVVIEQVGAPDSSYEEFLAQLHEGQCRYAVYDYAYTNADNCVLQKLVFINWAPDGSTIKSKMMYAATKDFFKGFLDGIGAELQATDMSELAESEMRDRVYSALTRK